MRTHAAGFQRRLAGFAFEAAAPQGTGELPRMDVALFAGFAARGPVGIPVAVEDARQFARVFGGDAPLAWDTARGAMALAQLAGAVRLFFANGGRRCWVLRLARDAQADALPVPGVARIDAGGAAAPLVLAAASPGRWADSLTLASSLTSARAGFVGWLRARAIEDGEEVADLSRPPIGAELQLTGAGELAAGDLLRFTWPGSGLTWYAGIRSVGQAGVAEGANRRRVQVAFDGRIEALAESGWPASLEGGTRWRGAQVRAVLLADAGAGSPPAQGPAVTVRIAVAAHQAPSAGDVLVLRFGEGEMLLAVTQADAGGDAPGAGGVVLQGTGRWRAAAVAAPEGAPAVERLRLALWARGPAGEGGPTRIDELGLGPAHARHPHRLPSDAQVYGQPASEALAAWREAPQPPVAGAMPMRTGEDGQPVEDPGLCLPFAVATLPGPALAAHHEDAAPLVRDGLARFDAALFGDAELLASAAAALVADGEDLRMRPGAARAPAGLHAALALEEPSLLAVPDAVQPGWVLDAASTLQAPEPPPPAGARDPRGDDFIDCGSEPGPAPTLFGESLGGHAVRLHWLAEADGPFVIEEARQRDWSDATVAWQGSAREAVLDGRGDGDAYYRVRSIAGPGTAWSTGVALRIGAGNAAWRMRRADEFDDATLCAVHRLLLRLALARGDLMALLSLPVHYREDQALAHRGRVAAGALAGGANADVPVLGGREGAAFDHAALYHGWLHGRDEDGALRTSGPDGAAAGVMARRALERGAWIAPANEPLRGVVALERPAPPERWPELLQAQVNVLRHEARGFLAMSADTLAADDDLRPIGVRRLLALLRRAALRRGALWVFEPNDDSFRRGVERSFEAMLADLFRRGAFTGSSARSAFQVVADATVNTRQSIDAGRFVVELRVAPSRPLCFLTIRLTQSGERLVATGN